jgi:hypothetical protein
LEQRVPNHTQGEIWMKNLKSLITLLLIAFSTTALATESENFMKCSGSHHGWYLDFFAVSNHDGDLAQVNIIVSTDADPEESPYRIFQIDSIEKNGQSIKESAFRWVIKQAVSLTDSYGYVKVSANGIDGESKMYLNFNIFGDVKIQNAVSIDGDIQSLTCFQR